MSNQRRRISFFVPLVMIKNEEFYVISCKPLGIFCQEYSENAVKEDFETCVNMLLKRWQDQGTLEKRLKARGLLGTIRRSYWPFFT